MRLRLVTALAALASLAVLFATADVVVLRGGPHRRAESCGGGASGPSRLVWLRVRDGRTTTLVVAPGLNHPAFSPDGRLIAYLSHSNGIVASLQVCDLGRRATRPVRMPIPAGNFSLSWDGNGGRIVFLGGDTLGFGADQKPFVVAASGRGLRQLAGNAPWYYDGAALSPDGTKLALLLQWKYPHDHEPEQLAVFDTRTGKLVRVAGSSQVAEIDAVSWSPDGKRIVLSAYRENSHGGLYVVDVATKRLTPVLVRGAGAADPAWSPDGHTVAFVRAHSIWTLDLQTHRETRVTRDARDSAPAWSPDGRTLVFVRR